MNMHNICFHGEFRKLSIPFEWKSLIWSYTHLTKVSNLPQAVLSTYYTSLYQLVECQEYLLQMIFCISRPENLWKQVKNTEYYHLAWWVKFSADDIMKYFQITGSDISWKLSCMIRGSCKKFEQNKWVWLAIEHTIQVQWSILKYTWDKIKEAY